MPKQNNVLSMEFLRKGKILASLNYCINQERYFRVFLEDGDINIDYPGSRGALNDDYIRGVENVVKMNEYFG